MIWQRIIAGLAIGCGLGVLNILLLRLSVTRALGFKRGWRAALFIFGCYLVRYAVIGGVIYLLLRQGGVDMALVTLAVLGALTVLLALAKRYPLRCGKEE